MALKATDLGMLHILNVFFGWSTFPTAFYIELFTDANPVLDSDDSSERTLATGGGYAEADITADVDQAVLVGGIPTITWGGATGIVFEFSGALTGNPTINGYMILADTVIIHQELLADPFTPANAGDTLTIFPLLKMGNTTDAAAIAA
jgi:hypothetical protein